MTKSKTCFTLDFNYYYITVIREVTCQLAAFFKPGATLSGLFSGGDAFVPFRSMSEFAFAQTECCVCALSTLQCLGSHTVTDISNSLCRLQFWSISGSHIMQCLNQWDFQKGKDVTFCRWLQFFANCKCCFRGSNFEGKLVKPAWKFFSRGTKWKKNWEQSGET